MLQNPDGSGFIHICVRFPAYHGTMKTDCLSCAIGSIAMVFWTPLLHLVDTKCQDQDENCEFYVFVKYFVACIINFSFRKIAMQWISITMSLLLILLNILQGWIWFVAILWGENGESGIFIFFLHALHFNKQSSTPENQGKFKLGWINWHALEVKKKLKLNVGP